MFCGGDSTQHTHFEYTHCASTQVKVSNPVLQNQQYNCELNEHITSDTSAVQFHRISSIQYDLYVN